MALPTTISDVVFPSLRHHHLGPFLSSGGNVYIVLRDSATSHQVNILKATDPTSSFSEVATSVGTSGESMSYMTAAQRGDLLHIATVATNVKNVRYWQFNMATDAWVTENDDSSLLADMGSLTDDCVVAIAARSTNDVVVLANSSHKEKGVDYLSVHRASRVSSAWTNARVDDAGSAARHVQGSGQVMGESDVSHLFYHDQSHIQHKTLTGTTLSSQATASDNAVDTRSGVVPAYYDAAGDETIVVGWRRTSDSKAYTSYRVDDGSPVWEAEAAASDNTVELRAVGSGDQGSVAQLVVDGTTVYLPYANDADQDLYLDSNTNNGGWGTDTEILDAVTVNRLSANIYTRSGSKVLAYVYNDGGTVKYNEYALAVAATAIRPYAPQLNQAVTRAAYW